MLLNKSVESWELKVVPEQKKVGRLKENKVHLKMDDMGEEAVVEVEYFQHLLQIKIFTYVPRFVSFDFGSLKIYNRLAV